ncbi:hypothetical protein ACWDYJ_32740 [Streptomyces sp. NPDC003042]
MPDRRQPDSSTDDNPFAAPPEGRPDQPWQPRDGGGTQGPGPSGPGPSGPGPSGPAPEGPARWDPMDPLQRRARYALLAGMWGFFFGIFGIPSMGLMLGALAMYWGISALRAKPAPQPPDPAARPQRAAAVSGLVTASLALALAASSYALQITYKDFYVCREDALTRTAELQCNTLLPDNILGDILKVQR